MGVAAVLRWEKKPRGHTEVLVEMLSREISQPLPKKGCNLLGSKMAA